MSWKDILESGGIFLTEDTAAKVLVEGLQAQVKKAGVTLTVTPEEAYAIPFSYVKKDFCSKYDSAIEELAPHFYSVGTSTFEGDIDVLAQAVGDEHAIVHVPTENPLDLYSVAISSAYMIQRAAILNLFVDSVAKYTTPVIVKSTKVNLPTAAYAEDQDGTWSSQDVTVASMSDDVVTVVTEGLCKFDFVGTDPENTGTITCYCMMEPDVNVVKNALSAVGYNYHTPNGIRLDYVRINTQGEYTSYYLKLNGTTTDSTTMRVLPQDGDSYMKTMGFASDTTEGDLLLWVEELDTSGSCTIPDGVSDRIYIDFCKFSTEQSDTYDPVSVYQLDLYDTSDPTKQLTKAKLIRDDKETIRTVRIYAPAGTVFNNYKIVIGIKKYSKNGLVYNGKLLEPYLWNCNEYVSSDDNRVFVPCRLSDGSYFLANKYGNYRNNLFKLTTHNNSTIRSWTGPNPLLTGDHITEVGKAYKFTVRMLRPSPPLGNYYNKNQYVYFTLFYADGSHAASIPLMMYKDNTCAFTNGVASVSFVSEKVVDFLGYWFAEDSFTDYNYGVFAFELEEINPATLDLTKIEIISWDFIPDEGQLSVIYTPGAIVADATKSELIWSSSDTSVATIDSTGKVTVHKTGDVTFTATSVRYPSISDSATIPCKKLTNILGNLLSTRTDTVQTNVGLTLRYNGDDTITLNGTFTGTTAAYIATYPDDICLTRGNGSRDYYWIKPVSGSISNPTAQWCGMYGVRICIRFVNGGDSSIYMLRTNYDRLVTGQYAAYRDYKLPIKDITLGFHYDENTVFDNYTLKLGYFHERETSVHPGLLENYLPSMYVFTPVDQNHDMVFTRYRVNELGGHISETTRTGYLRVTSAFEYNNTLSNLITGDSFGDAEEEYKLTVDLKQLVYDRTQDASLKFGIAYEDGTVASEIDIVNPADYTADEEDVDLSGTTYTTTFTTTKKLGFVYQYFGNIKIKQGEEYFFLHLDGITTLHIFNGESLSVNDDTYKDKKIVVHYGGVLDATSGAVLDKIVEDGGRASFVEGTTLSYLSNVISGVTFDNDRSVKYCTVHSATSVVDCIIVGNGTSNTMNVNYGYVSNLTVTGSGAELSAVNAAHVNSAVIQSGGYLYISNTSNVSNIEINDGGSAEVLFTASGNDYTWYRRAAQSFVINPGGFLSTYSSGYVDYISENGGYVVCDAIFSRTFASNVFSGDIYKRATVHSGTTATNITIHSSGVVSVYSSGVVDTVSTMINGSLMLGSLAMATSIIENGGYVDINSTASAVFASNATTVVFESDVYATATVHSNTVFSNTSLYSCDFVSVFSGGIVKDTTVSSGYLTISDGGLASNVAIVSGGVIFVYSGGTALEVDQTPYIGVVYSAEGATVTYVDLSGVYYGSSGQLASREIVMSDFTISGTNILVDVYSGGTAINTSLVSALATVHHDGIMQGVDALETSLVIQSGGYVSNLMMNEDCQVIISNALIDTVNCTNENDHIFIYGGTVYHVDISNNECQILSNNCIVSDISATDASVVIDSGASAYIKDLSITATGSSCYTTITPYASSVTISNFTISADAYPGGMYVTELTTLTGRMNISGDGAIIEPYDIGAQGTIIDFNLNDTTPETDALLNGYDKIVDPETFNYTLHIVENSEEVGDYNLAAPVTEFNNNIVVKNSNDTVLGLVYVNRPIDVGQRTYVLVVEDDTLIFRETVYIPPIIGTIVNYGESLTIPATSKYEGTIVNGGSVTVLSEGIANSTIVNPGGQLTIEDGAIATVIETGGEVINNDDTTMYLPSVILGVTLSSTVSMTTNKATIHSGTTVISATIGDGIEMHAYSGGIVTSAILDGGTLIASASAVVSDINKSGGTLIVQPEGSVVNVSVASDVAGSIIISSGGTMICPLVVTSNETTVVSSGGIIMYDLTTTSPNNTALLSEYTDITGDPTYYARIGSNISNGSYNLAATVTSDYNVPILAQNANGEALHYLVNSGMYFTDTEKYTTYVSNGVLVVSKEPMEWDLIITGDKKINISGSKHAVLVKCGDAQPVKGCTIDYLVLQYTGYWNGSGTVSTLVEDGGHANKTKDYPDAYVVPNIASDIVMKRGENLRIHSGTTYMNVIMNASNYTSIYSGAIVSKMRINNAGRANVMVAPGGVVIRPTIIAGVLSVAAGGSAIDVISSGGTIQSAAGAYITYATAAEDEWTITVSDNQHVSVIAFAGATLTCSASARARYVRVDGGASASIYGSDVIINSCIANPDATVSIYSGATVSNAIENGGYIGYSDANVTFVPHTFSGAVVFYSATIHSGTTAVDIAAQKGRIYVYSGGVVSGADIHGSAADTGQARLIISSGGTGIDLVASTGDGNGIVDVYGTVIHAYASGGTVNFYSGCILSDYNWLKGSVISSGWILSGTTITNINNALAGGASANDIIISARLIVNANATATNVTMLPAASMIVSSGATANGVIVSSGASLNVHGTALHVTSLNDAAIISNAGAVIEYDEE